MQGIMHCIKCRRYVNHPLNLVALKTHLKNCEERVAVAEIDVGHGIVVGGVEMFQAWPCWEAGHVIVDGVQFSERLEDFAAQEVPEVGAPLAKIADM